jgi:hypothetical protein
LTPEPLPSKFNYAKMRFLMVFVKSYMSDDPMEFLTSELHPDYAVNVTYDIFLNFKLDQALKNIPKLFFFDVCTHPSTCLDPTG